MDVSDESIKQEAMRVVWMFSGVTFVDIKEKGILKVKGIFDKIEMGSKLQEIDKSVDIINQMGKPGQSRIPGLSTVYSYLTTPKIQEILVFKFKVLNFHIIPDVMEVIWEFSGTHYHKSIYGYVKPNKSMIVIYLCVTSVEVKGDDQVEVNGGDFNKIAMAAKLKGIDENVSVSIKAGPDVPAPNFGTSHGQSTISKISNALSSIRLPSLASLRVPPPPPPPPSEPMYARGRGRSFDHDHIKPYQRPILDRVRDFVYNPNANKPLHHAVNIGREPRRPQKEKCVLEIPKPQSATAGTSNSSTTIKGTNTEPS
ncbi:hypothetical protein CARUB_v10027617mg [Capsella rubella]|uniref:HMA domain-containing protein n=1 Tax=Capsella rubella TaxID=81985 RepID=R0EZL8_9BRAS|nr:hypothetical protein CARUB_v10027617mg [Capsella rubella]